MTAAQQIIRFDSADTAAGGTPRPFAKAVRAGDFVFVSGQVIIDVLKLANCTLADVVKVNIWLDDPRDFTSFNAVFEKHFIANPPARSTVQSALMVDAKIEMDVTAFKPL